MMRRIRVVLMLVLLLLGLLVLGAELVSTRAQADESEGLAAPLYPATSSSPASASDPATSATPASSDPPPAARPASLPEPTSTITELVNAGASFDGQEVIFTGEAIGDIINAGEGYRWLTLEDDGASISVYVSAEDAASVSHLGRHNQLGTTLLVRGIFELDCEKHDGLVDVHASEVIVLDPGADIQSTFNLRELQVGGLLIVIAAGLFVVHWRLRERSR
jgi:hypothetical protein